MSLYGDLPQAKDEDTGSKGWAAASKKLQPSFRKPSNLLAPPSVARGGPGRAGGRTPGASGRGAGRGPPPTPVNTVVHANAASFGSQQQGPANPAPAAVHSAFSFFTVNGEPLKDEYDPSKPNDYEEIVKKREKKKREAEEEAERLARLREVEQEIERRKREQAEAAAFIAAASKPPPGTDPAALQQQPLPDPEEEAEHTFQGLGGIQGSGLGLSSSSMSSGGGGGSSMQNPGVNTDPAAAAAAAAAVVKQEDGQQQQQQQQYEMDEYEQERQRRLKLSGDEAFKARARLSSAAASPAPPDQHQAPPGFSGLQGLQNPSSSSTSSSGGGGGPPGGAEGGKGMGLAQKLLEKMGWREGQGLGRFRQGMATPLVAQKTAAHAGVIVNADQPPDKKPRLQGAAFRGTPTRVLLLRNMVGPGEVDEDLEEEVGTELSKYGNVEDVVIFEVTTPGFDPEEAVRIFIKFDRAEASTRALVDLQGRFFGGRQVRAAFFNEDRFEKQQLAPQAGEFD